MWSMRQTHVQMSVAFAKIGLIQNAERLVIGEIPKQSGRDQRYGWAAVLYMKSTWIISKKNVKSKRNEWKMFIGRTKVGSYSIFVCRVGFGDTGQDGFWSSTRITQSEVLEKHCTCKKIFAMETAQKQTSSRDWVEKHAKHGQFDVKAFWRTL